MTHPWKILIVGAGIGGLSAAVALAQVGVEVEVVEIEEASRAPGVGFGLRTNGMRAIREIGLLDACVAIGTVGGGLNYYDNEGNHLSDLYYEEPEEGMPSNLNLSRLGFVEAAKAR